MPGLPRAPVAPVVPLEPIKKFGKRIAASARMTDESKDSVRSNWTGP